MLHVLLDGISDVGAMLLKLAPLSCNPSLQHSKQIPLLPFLFSRPLSCCCRLLLVCFLVQMHAQPSFSMALCRTSGIVCDRLVCDNHRPKRSGRRLRPSVGNRSQNMSNKREAERVAEESSEGSSLKKRCSEQNGDAVHEVEDETQDHDETRSLDGKDSSPAPRNVVGVIGKSLLYPTLEELGLALPMDLVSAQKASIFRKAGFLKAEEASKLISRFQRLRLQPYTNNSDLDYDADGNAIHCTFYLNDRGLFRQKFAGLRSRVLALAQQANEVQKWGMDMSNVSVRVAEFHDYRRGGSLPEKDHYDKGSLVTVDVMLEEADEGGEFQTSAGESGFEVHAFRLGNAVVFPSHKYHSVSPVLQGVRRVLVVEIWSGEERLCGHRCELIEGECDFDADAV